MVFPDFYRLPIFGLAVFCGKAWRKKIPERSEDDFFPANQPGRPPCTKNAIQDLCRVKTEKHLFAFGGKTQGGEKYHRGTSPLLYLNVSSSFFSILVSSSYTLYTHRLRLCPNNPL